MKKRSLLDAVALELFYSTTSLLLTSLMGSLSPLGCILALLRCFFSSFSNLFAGRGLHKEEPICNVVRYQCNDDEQHMVSGRGKGIQA